MCAHRHCRSADHLIIQRLLFHVLKHCLKVLFVFWVCNPNACDGLGYFVVELHVLTYLLPAIFSMLALSPKHAGLFLFAPASAVGGGLEWTHIVASTSSIPTRLFIPFMASEASFITFTVSKLRFAVSTAFICCSRVLICCCVVVKFFSSTCLRLRAARATVKIY
jgi:hypothetical protein